MAEFDLDAYLNNKQPAPSVASDDKLGALAQAQNKKVADLQSVVDGTSANQVEHAAVEAANKNSWASRLGLDADGIPGEAVNMGASVVDGTAKMGTQIIGMVPTINAAILNQGVPDEVKLAWARIKNGAEQPGDAQLLDLPFGDIDPNRPLTKYQAIDRATAKKTGTLQTNRDRMEKLDHALKFGEDLREQTDISSIVHKGNQQELQKELKDGYKPAADKISKGWEAGGIGGAADVASGIASLITNVGSAAWNNKAAAMELIASNAPQLAAAAVSGGAMATTNIAYAMEEYSKGIEEYQKQHNGQMPTQEELGVMALKAGSLAVAEYAGDKFMLGAKVIPGQGKLASAIEKTALGRTGAAVGEGAAGEFATEYYQTGMERSIEGKEYSPEENYVGGSMGAIAGGGLSAGTHALGPAHVSDTPKEDVPVPPSVATQEAHTAAKETGDVSALTDPENAAYAPEKAIQALMAHAKKDGSEEVQMDNLSQSYDILNKFSDDYSAKVDKFEAMTDKTTPEAKALAAELGKTKKQLETADKVVKRFQDDYFASVKVADKLEQLNTPKVVPEDGGEATVAPEATEAANTIINLSMSAPERVSVDDAQKLIDHEATTPEQKDYLRKFSATRVAENELRDINRVSAEIADGSKDGKNLGIKQYRAQVADAIASNSEKKANSKLDLLTKFMDSHSEKAKLAAEAYADYQDTGKPVQVQRNEDIKSWELVYDPSKFLTGKDRVVNGAVTIDHMSKNLVPNIQKEADAIAAAHAELRSAIALRFNGGQNVSNPSPAQAAPVGAAPVATAVPVPAPAKAAAPVAPTPAPAQPVAEAEFDFKDEPLYAQAHALAQTMKDQPLNVLAGTLKKELGVGWNRAMRMVEGIEAGVKPTVDQSASGASTEVSQSTDSGLQGQVQFNPDSSVQAPEVPSGTKNSTESDQQKTTGLSVLKQAGKDDKIPEGKPGEVYTRINRARQFLKQKLTKVEKDSDINQSKPLADIDNLLTKMNDGIVEPDNLIEGGMDDEQRTAVETFQKYVTKWSADIKKLLIKGSLPNSKGNQVSEEFRYEDPIQDFFNEDGTMDENVVTAIGYGAFSWLNDTTHAPPSKSADDLLEMHGYDSDTMTITKAGVARLRGVAAMETAVVNELGNKVVKALGLSAKPDAPLDYLPNLATAFGIHALQVLKAQGLVTTDQVMGNEMNAYFPGFTMEAKQSITYVSLTREGEKRQLPADSRAIRDALAGTGNIVDKLFDSERAPTEASWEPIPFKQEFAKRTNQSISKEQTKVLEKAQKVPHRIIPTMWTALKVLGDDVILKAAGWKEANDDKIHVMNRDSVQAQNENLESQLDSLKGLVTHAEAKSELGLEQPFFVNFEVWRNFRVGIATRDLNPQTSKIHRFMVYRPEWKATIKTQDAEQFLIGVAQAMGVKVDQQRNKQSLEIFAKKAQDKGIDALATKLYEANQSPESAALSTKDKEAIADLAAGAEGMQTLQALVAYGVYLNAKDKGDATFESHMLVGVDGKTNGPILSQLALGAAANIKSLFSRLNRGGMYRQQDGVKNYNLWYEQDSSLDLYEDLADHVLKALPNNASIKAIQTFTKELLTKDGKVSSAGRKIVKTPLTAFTFGSAVAKSVESMRDAFIQSIYDKIEAVADGSDKTTTRRQIVESLNKLVGPKHAFPDNTSIEQLMALDLNKKENAGKLAALEQAFQDSMGKTVEETMGNYFKVFGSRRSAVNKSIQTSFAIYNALYQDLYAKEMDRLMADGEIAYRDIKRKEGNVDRVPLHGMNAKQKAALDAKVASVLPQAHTAYSQGEQNLDAGLYMAKSESGRSEQPYGYAKVQFGQPIMNADGKPITSMKASSLERREVGPGAAGLPYFMHSSDSAIMHRALSQFVEAMNVHDEIGNGADKVRETAKAINGATWKTLLTFSPATEAFNMMERSVTNVLKLAENGTVSPEVLKEIQASFEALLYQDEEVSPADLPVHILSRLRGQQYKADKTRLQAMAEMTAIDQYTWEDGQYDVTDADRAEARALLAKLEEQGAPIPEATEAAAIKLGELFVKGVKAAEAQPVAPVIKIEATPATALWAVQQAVAALGSKEAKQLEQAVMGGQNLADAINAMPEGAGKDEVVEAVTAAVGTVDEGIWTPFGQLGTPTVPANTELVKLLQSQPSPKELIKGLLSLISAQKDWNSKLQGDMLRVLYKLVDDKMKVNYITPETKAAEVLALPTEASRGWFVAKGPLSEVNILSPDFVDSGITPELVVHELLHSVLARAIKNPTTPEAKELVADLKQLLVQVNGYVKDNKIDVTNFAGGLKSVDELLAWGLTNHEFQQKVLGVMKATTKTSGNKLVTAMRSFLDTIASYLFKTPTAAQQSGLAVLVANASGLFKYAADNKAPPKAKDVTVLSMAVQRILNYDTHDVFNALDDGRLSDDDKQRITGVLTSMVDKLHGPFGSLREGVLNSQAGTALDAFIQAEQAGQVPFASAVIASPFAVSQQVAFALEQAEVTVKTALDSPDAAAKTAYSELTKLFVEARAKLKGQLTDEQHEFLFAINKDNGDRSDYLARFAAMAMVHPEVNSLMQEATDTTPQQSGGTFADKVQRLFEKLLALLNNKITGTFEGQRADLKLARLVQQLVDIEVKNKQVLARRAETSAMLEPIEDMARTLADKGRDAVVKAAKSKFVKDNKNQFIRTAGVLADYYASDRVEAYLEGMSKFRNTHFKGTEGILASLVTEAKGHLVVFQEILREAKRREGERKDMITQGAQAVLAAFQDGANMTDAQKAGVSAIFMRSGAHNLLEQFSLKDIEAMLADPAVMNRNIIALEKKLGTYGSLKDAVIEQARVLGYYKATGYTRGLLHTNAHNISRLLGTKHEGRLDHIMAYRSEATIASLVSLYAMAYASQADQSAALNVLRTENARGRENGIEFTLKLHKHLEAESLDKLFKGNPTLMMHGYTPEVYNPNTAIQVAGEEEGAMLVKQGWRKGPRVTADSLDQDSGVQHIYVQRDGGMNRRVTGAFSLSDTGAKGTHLAIENPKQFTQHAMARFDNQSKGGNWKEFANRNDNHAAPIFNEAGRIVDWRYLMAEQTKNTILERDNRFEHLMGKMAGSVYDKQSTPEQNKVAVEVLREEYNKSYADNPNLFEEIGASVANDEMRQIWNLLPQQTKQDIRKIWGRDALMVRKDSVNILFGNRKLSMADSFTKEDKGFFDKTLIQVTTHVFGDKAEWRTRQFERNWQAVVQEIKDIVVVKTGTVLLGNIKSNMWLLAIAGVPMKDMLNSHLVALRGATAYRKDADKLAQLKLTKDADYLKGVTTKELDDEINRLEDSIARNPVKELIDAGLMPSIVEDVAAADDIYSYRSKFAQNVDSQMAKLPPVLQRGIKNVYMAHDTKLYQGLNRVTQLSDFVARYTLYQHLTTRKKNPLSKQEAIQQASEAFVNYDIPMHPFLQYLDDMGIMPFMKYFLRIQKVIVRLVRENPARVLTTLALDNLLNLGETVLDSSFLHKVGNNPLTTGAFRYFGVLDELATVNGAMALIK